MKVSVVIPVFNEEKYIRTCLVSLKNQVEEATEILVVNNNSTDRTVAIAKEFGARIVNENKQGITHARNRGFDSAKYDIIARCDADSILPKNWVKKIKDQFEKERIDALVGPVFFYDVPVRTALGVRLYMTVVNRVLGHYPLNGPNMALTKNVWNRVKGAICPDDSKVHEDIDLSIHIYKVGGRIKYDRSLLVRVSGRRVKHNPWSFFFEYPLRFFKMIREHEQTHPF